MQRIGDLIVKSQRWPLLHNRDYMLLWSGEILSELGSQTSAVAYPLLILTLTGSAAEAGVVGLAKWLPLAIFAVPAGVLVDRLDRRHLMIASEALRLLGAASIVGMLLISAPSYPQIIVVAFLDGTLYTVSYISERAALPQLVERELLPNAVAQNGARSSAANIAGPPFGGALFAIAQALPFIADAATFLCSMTALSLTRTPFQSSSRTGPATPRKIRAEIADGFRWLWRHPFFRATSLLFAVGNPVYTGFYLLAILLARHHGASTSTVGLVLAIVGVGGVLGAFAASTIRKAATPRTLILIQQWLLLLVVLALLIEHNPLLIGLLIAAGGFVAPTVNSAVGAARVAAVPVQIQGRVQAAATMCAMSLGWLGPLEIGVTFQDGGPNATVLILAAWALIPALFVTIAPALRGTPPPPQPPPER